MKKLVLITWMLVLLPFTAFALQPLTDGGLDEVTGQTGVTIKLDNLDISQTPADIAWSDDNGSIVMNTKGATSMIISGNITIDVDTVDSNTAVIIGFEDLNIDSTSSASARTIYLSKQTDFTKGIPESDAVVEEYGTGPNGQDVTSSVPALGSLWQEASSTIIHSGSIAIYAHE